jgi:hypothetical protein
MLGINLTKKKGVLELYDIFNKGGSLKPYELRVMEGHSFEGFSTANTYVQCEVSNNFGGPYFDEKEKEWQVPAKFGEHLFSWHFLVDGIFDELEIPCNKYSYNSYSDRKTYPKDGKKFSRILGETKKGERFIELISERQRAYSDALVNQISGFSFKPEHKHNQKLGAIVKGDKFHLSIFLDYWPHRDLKFNLENSFYKTEDEKLIIPSSKVKRVAPFDF